MWFSYSSSMGDGIEPFVDGFMYCQRLLNYQTSKNYHSHIGVGDRGAARAIALSFVNFGSVASEIRATQNIFRAVFDSLKSFFIF